MRGTVGDGEKEGVEVLSLWNALLKTLFLIRSKKNKILHNTLVVIGRSVNANCMFF